MPKRLLLVADDPAGRGGTEIRLLQTAASLPPARWRPLVVVPSGGHLYDLLMTSGVDTRVLNFYRLPRYWRLRRLFPLDTWITLLINRYRFRKLLERESVALVHTVAKQTLNVWNVAQVARQANIPVVWSCGDSNPQVLGFCRRGLGSRLNRIIAISQHVKEALLHAGLDCPEKIEVLHNAIDLPDWDARLSKLDGSLRAELGLAPGRPLVGLVARLDPVKGQHTFLQAAELVAQTHTDVAFVLVGVIRPKSRRAVFARYFAEVEALAQRPALRARVKFLDWRSDLPDVMASLDILVQPSRRETFGRVLIEAMASRKPVIATRIGGMPEIVTEGVTGILVHPEDPRDLAAAILELLRDPNRRRTMGDAGRRRVETYFGLPQRIHRLQTIYDRVLGQSNDGDSDTRSSHVREDRERPPALTR